MKKASINKKALSLTLLFASLLIAFSCSQKAALENKTVTIKGGISFLKESGASPKEFISSNTKSDTSLSRSTSVSRFTNGDLSLEVYATLCNSDGEKTKDYYFTSSQVNEDNELTYSMELPYLGNWLIEAYYEQPYDHEDGSEWILYGSKRIELSAEDTDSVTVDLELIPKIHEKITGSVNLMFYDDLAKGMSLTSVKVYCDTMPDCTDGGYECPFSLGEDPENPERNTARFGLAVVPAGHHQVRFVFYSEDGEVFSCQEVISVFSAFCTDCWYGTAPWFTENTETGETEFVLTDTVLTDYTPVLNYETPLLLWDMTGSATKGAAVFNAVEDVKNVTLPDGIMLGKLGIGDFTIDPVTQKIILFEKTAYTIYQLTEYPSYSGYSRGKVLLTNNLSVSVDDYTYQIRKICSYNGRIWATADGDGDADGENVILSFDTSNPSEIKKWNLEGLGGYEFILSSHCLTADDKYLFIANNYYQKNSTGKDILYITLLQFRINENQTLTLEYREIVYQDETVGEDFTLNTNSGIKDIQVIKSNDASEKRDIFMLFTVNPGANQRGGIIHFISEPGEAPFIKTWPDEQTVYGLLEYDVNVYEIAAAESAESIYNSKYANSTYLTEEEKAAKKAELETIKNQLDAGSGLYFYGPSRFIAKKPDELVIADEGEYDHSENKDRVYRFDLQDLRFKSAKEVGTGFFGYNDSSYYNTERQ